LDENELAAHLEPGGTLKREIETFEPRESQVEMLKAVVKSFNRDSICVVEAGTGVGKSMAYLIPAMKWAEMNEERVVVSTATINLQQQLVEKDIPLVKRMLPSKVKTVLVKGRGNYICRRRLEEALGEDPLFREQDSELDTLKKWVETSKTGSKTDLSFYPKEQLWSKVCSEADACMGLRCPYRETCFVLKARREASSAGLLIVNHHLLFSDLSMRISGAGFESTAVLPPFKRIIFDEAHNIENSATSFFSETMHRFTVAKPLFSLYRRKAGRTFGLALYLQKLSGQGEAIKKIPGAVYSVDEQMDVLDNLVSGCMGNNQTLRITPETLKVIGNRIIEPMSELQQRIADLVEILEESLSGLNEEDSESSLAYEIRIVVRRLSGILSICEQFHRIEEHPGKIFWIEGVRSQSGDTFFKFIITPLDITDLMCEAVFEPYKTIVCTSATLAVRGNFSFWMSRVGLQKQTIRSVSSYSLPSPFPFREHVMLAVPTNTPGPDSGDYQDFIS
ncbi:MAG: ATP-dependent DNA helicase, partial [Spirochaetota bacterium]